VTPGLQVLLPYFKLFLISMIYILAIWEWGRFPPATLGHASRGTFLLCLASLLLVLFIAFLILVERDGTIQQGFTRLPDCLC
jgi:hypothetical protein